NTLQSNHQIYTRRESHPSHTDQRDYLSRQHAARDNQQQGADEGKEGNQPEISDHTSSTLDFGGSKGSSRSRGRSNYIIHRIRCIILSFHFISGVRIERLELVIDLQN